MALQVEGELCFTDDIWLREVMAVDSTRVLDLENSTAVGVTKTATRR